MGLEKRDDGLAISGSGFDDACWTMTVGIEMGFSGKQL